MAIYWGLWNLVFHADFHPIHECTFGLSFLTTLNMYKDYFKGWKRLCMVTQEDNSPSVKKGVTVTYFAIVLHSFQEAITFVHRRVLYLSNFMILIMWWTEKLCSQHHSQVADQVAYWDPRNWLVTYWEPCIEKERLSSHNKSNWVLG